MQLIVWAVKRDGELSDAIGKLSLIIPLLTILLAAICSFAYLSKRITIVVAVCYQ